LALVSELQTPQAPGHLTNINTKEEAAAAAEIKYGKKPHEMCRLKTV